LGTLKPLAKIGVKEDYERNTGVIIVEKFHEDKLDPDHFPGALVPYHGPFSWGSDPMKAVYHAILIEEVAKTALYTIMLNPDGGPIPSALLDKHFLRKHGPDAYYGQR